jgi:hypothetical protein
MEKIDYAKERNKVRRNIHQLQGEMANHLEMFGDELARQQKYRSKLDGIEALRYYLMQKHGWLPRDVMSMSYLEIEFALSEEKANWTVPKAFRPEADKKPKKP